LKQKRYKEQKGDLQFLKKKGHLQKTRVQLQSTRNESKIIVVLTEVSVELRCVSTIQMLDPVSN